MSDLLAFLFACVALCCLSILDRSSHQLTQKPVKALLWLFIFSTIVWPFYQGRTAEGAVLLGGLSVCAWIIVVIVSKLKK